MPTFYNFTENGVIYSFDDIFVPADLFRDGTLWIWGRGNEGQLGTNDTTNIFTPVTTFFGGNNWKQISASSSNSSFAIKTDGTLWVWGSGIEGQLGTNDTINRSTPVTTFAGGTDWKQVEIKSNTVVAIKTDGTLWTWGGGSNGKLGVNDETSRSTPVTTFAGGTNWKTASTSGSHLAAIKTDGTLWIWGSNDKGHLGINDTTDRSTPVTTFAGGTNWKLVNSGGASNLAIKTDGTLWTWGDGSNGGLGNNDTTDKLTPITTFSGGNNWKSISLRGENPSAIKTDGTLWTWALGSNGRLGTNDTITRSTPVTTFTGGTNWKQVSSGVDHRSAIKTDGTLWTWGQGNIGQLGINDTTDRLTPVTTFAGGNNWKTVSSGNDYTIAVTYEDPIL